MEPDDSCGLKINCYSTTSGDFRGIVCSGIYMYIFVINKIAFFRNNGILRLKIRLFLQL